jgi:hypothetical protein
VNLNRDPRCANQIKYASESCIIILQFNNCYVIASILQLGKVFSSQSRLNNDLASAKNSIPSSSLVVLRRNQETLGEDPFMIGQLGVGKILRKSDLACVSRTWFGVTLLASAAYTNGLQIGEAPSYLKVGGNGKHYVRTLSAVFPGIACV